MRPRRAWSNGGAAALPSNRGRRAWHALGSSPDVDPAPAVPAGRSVAVEIALPNDPRILVGMSANVDVIVTTHDGVLWVPPNAVLGRGAERSVWVVTNGVVHKRVVEVGIATWEAVEVKSGLDPNAVVVASLATAQFSEGARVEPREPK